MKKLFFVLALLASSWASAGWKVTFVEAGTPILNPSSLSCSEIGSLSSVFLANAGAVGYTVASCSSDPVIVGTRMYWNNGSYWTVQSSVFSCAAGTHKDTSTNTCVDDVTIAVASCMPSIRTISPCPSGYAPTNAIPAGGGAPMPFTSAYDGLPIQDMLYAIGIAVCGLLGISVGVRLG